MGFVSAAILFGVPLTLFLHQQIKIKNLWHGNYNLIKEAAQGWQVVAEQRAKIIEEYHSVLR